MLTAPAASLTRCASRAASSRLLSHSGFSSASFPTFIKHNSNIAIFKRMASSIPSTMKAIQIEEQGGPDVMKLKEIPVPRPGKGEVLIKVEYSG
jgi:hypothetical protein